MKKIIDYINKTFSVFNKKPELKEFSFIWYKKLETKGKTFYTSAFRTKVKGKDYEDAKEKLINFAMSKMKLVVVSENKFSKSDLASFEKTFEKLNNEMNKLFEKLNLN